MDNIREEIDKLKKALKETLDNEIKSITKNDQYLYAIIGAQAAQAIYKHTKLGYGVSVPRGTKEKFAPLADSYISARKGYPWFLTNRTTQEVFSNRFTKVINRRRKGISRIFGKTKQVEVEKFKYKIDVPLDSTTSPTKSNLTYTGDMLRDLNIKVFRDKVIIGFFNTESQQKAKWAQDGSDNRPRRIFMNLAANEYKNISQIVKEYLTEKINLAIKKEFR